MKHGMIIGATGLLVLGLVGCSDHDNVAVSGGASHATATSLYAPVAENAVLPFPSDLLFVDGDNTSGPLAGLSADGTVNAPGGAGNALIADLDRLDGFSTTDNLYSDFEGASIDLASANHGGVRLIDLSSGRALVAGRDFDVIRSPNVVADERLLIQPLKPLTPGAVYGVVITDELKTRDGGSVAPSTQFAAVSSPDAIGSPGNPAAGFSSSQKQQLAQLRQGIIQPLLAAADVPAGDAVVAWRFTTQTIGDSLRDIAAHPDVNPDDASDGGIRVQALPNGQGGQLTTGDVNARLTNDADLYQGTVDLAYYLPDANPNDDHNDGETPLDGYWHNDGTVADGHANLRAVDGKTVPCADVARPASTTGCYIAPQRRSVQSVPVLVAVPNANSPSHGTPPPGGWPIVIFQHGITGNRTDMFAIAPTLAAAGFVTVAIDLPLHGLPPDNPLAIKGHERTFDLKARGSDLIAPSGTYFINLRSPITSRDNTREAVADLIDLAATLRNDGHIPLAGGGAIPLSNAPAQFVGHSLGAIVGATLAGVVSDKAIDGMTLANAGGGILRLLDGSATFGPQIASGLAAAGISQGSTAYQNFLRIAQTVIDSADPINYATAAVQNHPLHLLEVIGGGNGGMNPPDLVVPNAVPANVGPRFMPAINGACPATAAYTPTLDTACVSGPLSGTNPLAGAMGLAQTTVSVPYARTRVSDDRVIRFTSGAHSTFLDPSAGTADGKVDPQQGAATTAEMQCETAGFLVAVARGDKHPQIPLGCAGN